MRADAGIRDNDAVVAKGAVMSTTEQSADQPAWYAQDPAAALTALVGRPGPGARRRRGAPTARRVRAESAGDGAAAEPVGGRARPDVEPDEHHAGDRRGRESCDRAGRDRHLRRAAGDVQRRDGLAAGAQGAGERRRTRATPGAACPGAARRQRRGRRVGRPRPGRHRAAGGGRRRARRRPDPRAPRRSRCRRPRSPARARRSRRTPTTLPEGDVALGDRTNIVFQNTQVTRGTASFVVTDTGQATQMGRIADMVTATAARALTVAA